MSLCLLGSSGAESSFEDASAFFNRLVDLCSTQNNADVLFLHLSQDMGFLDGLVDCISNNTGNLPAEQQIAAINALRALLLKSGEQLYDTSLEAYTPTPVPNMLSGIHEDLHNHLKTRAGSLAQRLVDDAKQPKKKADEAVFSTFRVCPPPLPSFVVFSRETACSQGVVVWLLGRFSLHDPQSPPSGGACGADAAEPSGSAGQLHRPSVEGPVRLAL